MKQQYVLVIFEEVPEATKLFYIPIAEAEKYDNIFEAIHGHYVNNVGWDKIPEMEFVCSAFYPAPDMKRL